jgi:hypothetical protein
MAGVQKAPVLRMWILWTHAISVYKSTKGYYDSRARNVAEEKSPSESTRNGAVQDLVKLEEKKK